MSTGAAAMTRSLSSPRQNADDPKRVVYLLGAGATHGCASFLGSTKRLIMPGLIEELAENMQDLVNRNYRDHSGIKRLVNDVVDEHTDFEQLITFLEDSTSETHRTFAADLKRIFSSVLRRRLEEVRNELGRRHSELYATLIDMHEVLGLDETLQGFLTLNYDVFLEHAIEEHHGYSVDHGVAVRPQRATGRTVRVLKLHGSFGWADTWPIEATSNYVAGLWIPPGIRKAKTQYPFNAIWGLARELLDCDILRIVGCNLGPNDWDLVSLLFTTMHTHASAGPYQIEIIAGPRTAQHIAQLFPYLNVLSLIELPEIGRQVVAETLAGAPREYSSLSDDEQAEAMRNAQAKTANAFEYWLRLKGELMSIDVPSLHTNLGLFMRFVEASG